MWPWPWPWPWGCGLDLGGCGLVNITALKYQLDSLWQCTAAPVRCVIGSFFLVFHELVFLVLPSLFSPAVACCMPLWSLLFTFITPELFFRFPLVLRSSVHCGTFWQYCRYFFTIISSYPIIERKDLDGVMSKDCKDTLQTLKTVTKRECDAKWEQSICQTRS